MRAAWNNLLTIWNQIGINQRITLVMFMVGIFAAMVGIVLWAHRPQYQMLYGGLSTDDGSEVVEALESRGIPYEIRGGGNSIYIPSSEVHRIRMDLAGEGIPSGDSVGYEIFDRGSFGVSDFVQRTNYVRAVQGELARTVSQLNGVRSARVMIVVPENRLLVTNPDIVSTASVLVDLGSGRLNREAVRSIRSLVANSVEGLQPNNVAVVDNHGNVLSDELDEDDTGAGNVAQIRHRQNVEGYLSEKVESMLTQVLGSNQAVVRVSADIDMESLTVTEEIFDPESQVVRTQTSSEEFSVSRESRPQGFAGTAGNIDTLDGGAAMANANSSDREQRSRNQTYEISRSQTNRVTPAGTIRSISAAVFVAPRPARDGGEPTPRTAEELERLRDMIALTLGITDEADIGRLVSVEESPFPIRSGAAFETFEAGWDLAEVLALVEEFAPIGLALIFFLVLLHMLRRTRGEPAFAHASTHESEIPEEENNDAPVSPDVLNELIRQKPDNVGTALRNWVNPDNRKS